VSFSSSAGSLLLVRKQSKVENGREYSVTDLLMLLQSPLVARKPDTSRALKFLVTNKFGFFIRKRTPSIWEA